jgi:predicted SAM-dependent methyltransferase
MLDLNDWNRYFQEGTLDALLAEHVWEHLLMEDGIRAARICHRYLKRGGYLRVAVPDGLFPDPAYIEFVRPGGTGPSAYDHKELYTYRTLRHIFESAGFNVKLLEYYDEQGQFHQLDWRIEDGKIVRSRRCYTGHSFGGTKYRSLILDAIKE